MHSRRGTKGVGDSPSVIVVSFFKIHLFLGCAVPPLLFLGFLSLQQVRDLSSCGAGAPCGGCFCCGAQALGSWA